MANYTIQLLHYYGESGLLGTTTASITGALIDKFDDQYANTLVLGEGDSYIPGPWLVGGSDPALNAVAGIGTTALGRPDIAIMNAFGTSATALGNHEFDLGSPVLASAIAPSGTGTTAWVGAQFPLITANLDFSADSALKGLADATLGGTATNAFAGKEAATIKGKIAPYTVITKGGEKIGIVGLTTYDLLSKSSPNGTIPKDDANPATSDLQEVAAYVQTAVDALKAAGINKIVMLDQLDTIERNKQLAPLVSGIDVMVAGGGHERLGDTNDKAVAFNGHNADFAGTYPIVTAGKDGKTTLIVTTDTEYSYLGRLVFDFDENGEIVTTSLNPTINGAYAANEASLQAAYGSTQTAAQIVASSTIGTQVSNITKAIDTVISTKDSNIFGYTNVYLEGDRAFGRAEEVNLGDISADANLFVARKALGADAVLASLKNGGGLRSSIGSIGEKGEKLPPTATGVKPVGAISQLDIENALRFDNKLMVFDTTPQGLLNILNYAAGLAPGNGGYAQIGGVRFSYDPTKAADKKVQDIAIYDLNGKLVAKVADNGVLLANAPAKISVSVLNFTANGGDGYPIKANATNFRYILDNGTLSAAIDPTLDFTVATSLPANAIGEQKAFQDYLKANYPTPQRAYSIADTPATQDQRIQNLQVKKEDTVLPGLTTPLSTVAAGKPKTILISLDGATNTILKEYLKTGVLDPTKGLGLLASKGVIASANQTITPSLTAPSHIAIATGSSAVNNDINGNSFHIVANPFTSNTSGFAAPIGGYNYQSGIDPSESNTPTANPLWLNLEKAGKTVVAATFPGADGVNINAAVKTSNGSTIVLDKASDRTVDYTVPFGAFGGPFFTDSSGKSGSGGRGFSLTAADFTVDKTQAVTGLTALGKKFYGDVKVANLETLTATALTGGGAAYNLQVAAIDTTDDSKVNYDTLVVFDANVGIKGAATLPSTGSAFIKVSDQKSSSFFFDGSNNKVGTAFFGATLAPDLAKVNLARYSAYYIPRPAESPGVIANVDDINTNIGNWAPQADFRFPERINTGLANFSDAELEALYEDQVKSFVEYQTKVAVRSIQQNPNADLVMTYIEQPDGSEHQFLLTDPRQATNFLDPNSIGAGQDAAKVARYKSYIEAAYKAADAAVQKIIDAVGVDANGKPNSNIIVTSDHGFAPFHTAVSLNNLLANAGLDSTKVRAVTSGPATNIYINVKGREPNGTVDPKDYAALQKQVIDILNAYVDANPNYVTGGAANTKVFDKVYNRDLSAISNPTANDIINARGNFIGEDTGDVFALLKEGYNFDGTQDTPVIRKGDTAPTATVKPVLSVPNFYGAHGYDPTSPAMQAIFLAAGPDIANKDLGQVNNIDIAPTIDKLLGVKPASTVDGKALDIFATKPALPKLTLLGQATYAAQSVTVKDAAGVDTTVGGLSGITYDAKTNSFYSISDDRKSNANEPGQPTRFYKLNIDLSTGKLDNSKVAFTGVTYLRKADGSQYTPQSTDTEDIGLTKSGTVFIASEGQVAAPGQIRNFPFVNEYNLADGKLIRSLPVPAKFQPDANLATAQTRGVYDNLGFESIAVTPDQKTLFTGGENALAQDGQRTSFPGSDPKNPTGVGRSRLIKFNLDTNKAAAEYLYNLDPTAAAPSVSTTGANNFATAGLVALTALDNNGNMLAIERSFSSVSATTPLTPETGNVIKIYQISVVRQISAESIA
jgi:2',3'-cyclic-nucleotide 2'-phosphodiesterase (5'-nucleotidase family)/predicted AlkP superfamily pyrophosphatase or phosphodiesterase